MNDFLAVVGEKRRKAGGGRSWRVAAAMIQRRGSKGRGDSVGKGGVDMEDWVLDRETGSCCRHTHTHRKREKANDSDSNFYLMDL